MLNISHISYVRLGWQFEFLHYLIWCMQRSLDMVEWSITCKMWIITKVLIGKATVASEF